MLHISEPFAFRYDGKAMPRHVSLCLIVRNEEATLGRCLSSVAEFVHEIIVVDTGSTDRTKEVASGFGARVFDYQWQESFAAARNESIRQATSQWIFWLDGDEWLDQAGTRKLSELFASLGDEKAVYLMKQWSPSDFSPGTPMVLDHARLFPNRPDIRWEYRVYEQIIPSARRAGCAVHTTEIAVQHSGYYDQSQVARKMERNLRLLQMEDREHPQNPYTLFHLGSVYQSLGRPVESVRCLKQSLGAALPSFTLLPKLFSLLVQGHHRLGQAGEAVAISKQACNRFPEDAELRFQQAMLERERGNIPGAMAALLPLSQPNPRQADLQEMGGKQIRSMARHELAAIYHELGRGNEAEALWLAVLSEKPDFTVAWMALADLYLSQGLASKVEALFKRLDADPDGAVEAAVVRARVSVARKEFGAARKILEEAIPRAPLAIWLRVQYSMALLREGHDWAAAEKALRDVLALDPNHAGAQENLAKLLQMQGRNPKN